MLIQLPVETWIEILDWLKRRDLLKKLDKLWDRQFTPIVQDWLHKYTRNVKIGRFWADTDGLCVRSCWPWEKVPFADVDMPGNITSFERIGISYLDSTVLTFLHRMRPLFHSIHFGLLYGHENESYRTALRFLMSIISDSIESMTLFYTFLQFFSTNYPSSLLNAKLLNIWGLVKLDATEPLVNWLFTPREDGQTRTLVLLNCGNPAGFWEKIRKRFLDPARQSASPFFIRIHNALPNQQLIIENVQTDEQLTANGIYSFMLISNCPLIVDQEWLAKKTEELRKWSFYDQQQAIWLDHPKLGPLDGLNLDDPQQQPSEENPQEKPGTSNAQNLEEEEEPEKKRARLI